MAPPLLTNRLKTRSWLLTLLVVLCVAMMGQLLLLEMHQHSPVDPAGVHCWICASGPVVALVTAALLVLPAETVSVLMEPLAEVASSRRVLLERRRGPPAHS